MRKSQILKSTVISIICAASLAGVANADVAKPIVAPAGDLVTALELISKQADIELVFRPEQLKGLQTKGVSGAPTAQEAVRKLLEGTRLQLSEDERTGAMMIGLAATSEVAERPARIASQAGYVRIAQSSSEATRQEVGRENVGTQAATEEDKPSSKAVVELEEVLVTGSHIRGAENHSSPVITFDRKDIEASGYATTQQLIQSLPQNLANVSDTTFGSLNGGINEVTYGGSGLNLRGLGNDATLVLLNGRRIAGGGLGAFFDVSLIPLSAIERIDVLADGASAIYGSDAVGGVVNLVLRKEFEGAETRLRYGSVTEGNHDELQAGQTLGHAWDSGRALLSYEYYRRTALDGADRDFIQLNDDDLREYMVIPEQKRQSVLAVFSQQLTDRVQLASDLFYSTRDSVHRYTLQEYALGAVSDVEQYGGSLGVNVDITDNWQIRLSGLFDKNESRQANLLNGSVMFENANESSLWAIDAAADGSLGRAPGGEIRLALGGQFRKENFVEGYYQYPARLDRDIRAVYAEMRRPWVGEANRRAGIEHLEMTVAGRFENYEDFGSAFNPKLGVAWAPLNGLNLRGTWGTSFKAPLLSRMNPADRSALVYEDTFASASGPTTAMALYGNVNNLRPEESTNWTAGFDFTPAAIPNLDLSMTYFDVKYEDRIRTPFPGGYDLFGVLLDSDFAAVVNTTLDPAYVAAVLSDYSRVVCFTSTGVPTNPCVSPPIEQIEAIVDHRMRNLAAVRVSGVDFATSLGLNTHLGDWAFGFGGQYLINNREQLVPGATETSQLNRVWRPVDFRLRGSVSFSRGPVDATAIINYTDNYGDDRSEDVAGPDLRPDVASWTTLDLTLRYQLGWERLRAPGQLAIAFSATNLLDRSPPFVGSFQGVYFDGVNANPMGRFLSLQLTANWGRR